MSGRTRASALDLGSTLALAGLRRLEAERAHRLTVRALATGLAPRLARADDPVTVAGLRFANRIGVAAGFDKDAEALPGLARMGFGHVEVGTLTPRPQPGNPRPRLFRLVEDGAVINRFGFNNGGHDAAHARIVRARERGLPTTLGVNVGANKDAEDRVADYALGIRRFADVADYLTVNVSSPNTPGLRDLQEGEALRRLLGAVAEARASARHRPVLVKIAPDLDMAALDALLAEGARAGLDGYVVSNTTIARPSLRSANAGEAGGLSGQPLKDMATRMLRAVRERVGPAVALIGVGGVGSREDAGARIAAGADLVQLYTGLVYGGVRLARSLLEAPFPEAPRPGAIDASRRGSEDGASGA